MLEVQANGRYKSIEWFFNGDIRFLPDDENFAHFHEVYYNESIGISDFGVYDVTLSLLESDQVAPVGVQFTVIQHGKCIIMPFLEVTDAGAWSMDP